MSILKRVPAFIATAVVALVALRLVHVPTMLALLASLGCGAVPVMALRQAPPRRGPSLADPEPTAVQPPTVDYRRVNISDVTLLSSRQDYSFTFSATVAWRRLPSAAGVPDEILDQEAMAAIRQRARVLARIRDPADLEEARDDLTLQLRAPLDSMRVRALAENVTLDISDADKEHLARLTKLRRDEEYWAGTCGLERVKREYFGAEVLNSPGSAVVWWLARNEALARHQQQASVQTMANDIGALTLLSDCATATDAAATSDQPGYVPPPSQAPAGDHVLQTFAAQVSGLVDHYGLARPADLGQDPPNGHGPHGNAH